jgi:hypothetical protein
MFFVNTRVRPGAIAYTLLFNFAIVWVMQKAVAKCALQNHSVGISLRVHKVTDLDDDIALLADNADDLRHLLSGCLLCSDPWTAIQSKQMQGNEYLCSADTHSHTRC